jgi:Na+/melibiose symporter-like transporter
MALQFDAAELITQREVVRIPYETLRDALGLNVASRSRLGSVRISSSALASLTLFSRTSRSCVVCLYYTL